MIPIILTASIAIDIMIDLVIEAAIYILEQVLLWETGGGA